MRKCMRMPHRETSHNCTCVLPSCIRKALSINQELGLATNTVTLLSKTDVVSTPGVPQLFQECDVLCKCRGHTDKDGR